MKIFSTLLLLTAAVSIAGAAEFAKALNYRIIIPDKASAIEKAAADDLKLHLSKSYTKAVKLNGKTPQMLTFFVGISPESVKAGLNPRFKGEFGVFRKGDNFLFTGVDTPNGSLARSTDECGTFHSVSYFAQKYANVKIFMVGEQGIKYASNPEIIFPKEADIPAPSYALRGFQTSAKGIKSADTMLFFKRRLGRVPAWTRSNYSYWFLNSWNKRFKDKPEMFALHEGRRVNEKYPRHFPCTSNPAVLDQVEKDIAEVLKKRPAVNSIRLFSDAPVRSCECSNCRNSPAGKLVTPHDHSETVYAFFCQIARRVLKHKQGVIFHIQTKGSVYYQVPRTEKLPPNTVISVQSSQFIRPDYKAVQALCSSWRKAGARVLITGYPRAPEMKDFPLMNPHRIAEFFKNYQGFAEGSLMSEGRSKVPYSFSALNAYIHSAVMFDTGIDADKLIDEFCLLAAPKGSAELKEFYAAMEKLIKGAAFRDDPRFNCYSFDRLHAPRAILSKAVAKDPENKFLKQLAADFDNFMKTVNLTGPAVRKYQDIMKAYHASAEKRKLVQLSEKAVEFPFVPFAVYDDYQPAAVQLRQDKDHLSFKVICKENSPRDIRAVCTVNHSGQIWSDDVIETFIGSSSGAYPYIHLSLNAKGTYRVQLNTAVGKSVEMTGFPVKTKGTVGKGEWSVEASLPLKALAPVMKDKSVKIGFCRYRPLNEKRKGQLSAVQKSVSGGFHSDSGRFPVRFR